MRLGQPPGRGMTVLVLILLALLLGKAENGMESPSLEWTLCKFMEEPEPEDPQCQLPQGLAEPEQNPKGTVVVQGIPGRQSALWRSSRI